MFQGSTVSNFHCSCSQKGNCTIKSAFDLPEVSSLSAEGKTEILVNMNDFVTVSLDESQPLVTFGVADCVVVALYNPNFGRYFTHLLRDINYERTRISNVCTKADEDADDADDADECFECQADWTSEICMEKMYAEKCDTHCKACDDFAEVFSFKESLPDWVTHPATQAILFSQGEKSKLYQRYLQLRENGFRGNATIYIQPNVADDYIPIYGENKVLKMKKNQKDFFYEYDISNCYEGWKKTYFPGIFFKNLAGKGIIFTRDGKLKYTSNPNSTELRKRYYIKWNPFPNYPICTETYCENNDKGCHCKYLLHSNYP